MNLGLKKITESDHLPLQLAIVILLNKIEKHKDVVILVTGTCFYWYKMSLGIEA